MRVLVLLPQVLGALQPCSEWVSSSDLARLVVMNSGPADEAGVGLPVFVWDGCACCQVEAALNVELDAPFAFPGGAADEVSWLKLGIGSELEVAEPVVAADHAVGDLREVKV